MSPTDHHTPKSWLRLAVIFGLLLVVPARADTLLARVVVVIDGDTIDVLAADNQVERIRLQSVDAPERGQPFGKVSKQALSDLVFGKDVVVEWRKRDRNNRIVGKVLVEGYDVQLRMLQEGMAWVYVEFLKVASPDDQVAYLDAETRARDWRVGLWQEGDPLPPWEYRRAKRRAEEAR